MPPDDDDLLRRLRAGDQDAFAQLVRDLSPALLRVVRMYVPNAAVAEDVVQETWLGVVKGLDRFEGRSSLRTWIFTIAVNRARTRGEREQRVLPFAALAGAELEAGDDVLDRSRFTRDGGWLVPPQRWELDPVQAASNAETLRIVREALDGLPEMQRMVMTLRDLEGWDGPDVAAALEITEANQRVLLHRARAKVRVALEEAFAR
jgi:RNA polymerase sigma-70 factor, ECF subfamily